MEDKLSNLEDNLMDMMMRLSNLSEQVDILKNKTEQNRMQASEAKELADNATEAASELTKVHLLTFPSLYLWSEFTCWLYFCVCVLAPGFVTC